MFELRCMVEDKKLTKALWVLDGLIVGQPTLLPVKGAKRKGDKVVADGNVSIIEAVAALIYKQKLTRVKYKDIKSMVVLTGGNPAYTSSLIQRLRHLKVLGRGKTGSGYPVLPQKE